MQLMLRRKRRLLSVWYQEQTVPCPPHAGQKDPKLITAGYALATTK